MLTLPYGLTSRKLSPAALQLSDKSEAFTGQLVHRCFDPSSLLWCCYGWITGVPFWLGCLVSYLTGSSWCSMLLHCWYLRAIANRHNHMTPLLRSLHWLRVPERITFRLAVLLAYRCLHGLAPAYLAAELFPVSKPVDNSGYARHQQRTLPSRASTMPPWEVVHLQLQPRWSGTAYRMAPVRHRLWPLSHRASKLRCSSGHTRNIYSQL